MTLKAEHSLITQLCCRIRRRSVQCELSVLQTSALVLMVEFAIAPLTHTHTRIERKKDWNIGRTTF